MELENIVANTVYLKAREAADGMSTTCLLFIWSFVFFVDQLYTNNIASLKIIEYGKKGDPVRWYWKQLLSDEWISKFLTRHHVKLGKIQIKLQFMRYDL